MSFLSGPDLAKKTPKMMPVYHVYAQMFML